MVWVVCMSFVCNHVFFLNHRFKHIFCLWCSVQCTHVIYVRRERALCVMGVTHVISAKYVVFAACACVTGVVMYVLRVLCRVNYVVFRELSKYCDRRRGLTSATGTHMPRVAVCTCPECHDAGTSFSVG